MAKVSPPSVLHARLCIWLVPAEVYSATTASLPKPALPVLSMAALPLNTVPNPLGSIAAGWCSQCTRSRLVLCPQVMFCHFDP